MPGTDTDCLAVGAVEAYTGAGQPFLWHSESGDLRTWEVRCVLVHHEDVLYHGYQYVDWLFEGADMIAVIRTADDDDDGGAHNQHDANFLTFHRFKNFRGLTSVDSVVSTEFLSASDDD